MKNIYMVFDTETTTQNHIAYDVGFLVCTRKGEILFEYSSLVEDVVTSPELMRAAFYHNKLYQRYIPMLHDNDIELESWQSIFQCMQSAIEEFGVNVVASYNLPFDARVMRTMQSAFGNGAGLLAPETKTLCIWNLACLTRLNTNRFRNTADIFGWKSDKGNYRTNAEVAYRYLMNEPSFVEDHTALADCRIESQIMVECFRSKRAMPYDATINNPWKLVQREDIA